MNDMIQDRVACYYDSYYLLGYRVSRSRYKVFLEAISDVYSLYSSHNKKEVLFDDLKPGNKEYLISLIVKADPSSDSAIEMRSSELVTSVNQVLNGHLSQGEFFYHAYSVLCDHYRDEINRAFKWAENVQAEHYLWEERNFSRKWIYED